IPIRRPIADSAGVLSRDRILRRTAQPGFRANRLGPARALTRLRFLGRGYRVLKTLLVLARGREPKVQVPLVIQPLRQIAIHQVDTHLVERVLRADVMQRTALHPIAQRLNDRVVPQRDEINGRLIARRRPLRRRGCVRIGMRWRRLIQLQPRLILRLGLLFAGVIADLRIRGRRNEVLIDYYRRQARIRPVFAISRCITWSRSVWVSRWIVSVITAVIDRVRHNHGPAVRSMRCLPGIRKSPRKASVPGPKLPHRRRSPRRMPKSGMNHAAEPTQRPYLRVPLSERNSGHAREQDSRSEYRNHPHGPTPLSDCSAKNRRYTLKTSLRPPAQYQ